MEGGMSLMTYGWRLRPTWLVKHPLLARTSWPPPGLPPPPRAPPLWRVAVGVVGNPRTRTPALDPPGGAEYLTRTPPTASWSSSRPGLGTGRSIGRSRWPLLTSTPRRWSGRSRIIAPSPCSWGKKWRCWGRTTAGRSAREFATESKRISLRTILGTPTARAVLARATKSRCCVSVTTRSSASVRRQPQKWRLLCWTGTTTDWNGRKMIPRAAIREGWPRSLGLSKQTPRRTRSQPPPPTQRPRAARRAGAPQLRQRSRRTTRWLL
mmetsp:Transcript_93465/g.250359  ORF Transcript_93465/g.250359 Transcript_93465/m.250359 type:complete len:266 (+) Transcript_93465:297-1094(+)